MKTNPVIKSWAADDRPREKLATKGKSALSNAELLAILLGTGSRNKSAVDLAREVLKLADNDLHKLARYTVHDFAKVKGIGPAKATVILASMELANRKKQKSVKENAFIRSSADAYHFFGPMLEDKPHEEFWILMLSRNNKIIRPYRISEGGQEATVVDAKKIFKESLHNSASSLILCHNHPSGSITPSAADNRLTEKICKAGKQLDIAVIDHLIVGEDAYYSYADEGRI